MMELKVIFLESENINILDRGFTLILISFNLLFNLVFKL